MQFTITFDSLTLENAAKVEEMIQERFRDKKCEIKMIVVDLPEPQKRLQVDTVGIMPKYFRWNSIDTITTNPILLR